MICLCGRPLFVMISSNAHTTLSIIAVLIIIVPIRAVIVHTRQNQQQTNSYHDYQGVLLRLSELYWLRRVACDVDFAHLALLQQHSSMVHFGVNQGDYNRALVGPSLGHGKLATGQAELDRSQSRRIFDHWRILKAGKGRATRRRTRLGTTS